MRISHEAIYQALYIQGRGALKRELPVTRYRAILHLGRTLADQHLGGDERFAAAQAACPARHVLRCCCIFHRWTAMG
jgi:IS30 family transposase